MNVRVAIVGGGLGGLFVAWDLFTNGVDDLVLLERDRQPGGVARTVARDGYQLEPGASSFSASHTDLIESLHRAGVATVAATAGTRFVFDGDSLVPLTVRGAALGTSLASSRAKARAILEPFVPRKTGAREESLEQFMKRRFGREVGGELAWLTAAGVYAGDPTMLSTTAAFPALASLEADSGSVIRGALARRGRGQPRPGAPLMPTTGMAGLADGIAAALGHRYLGGRTVTSIARVRGGWLIDDVTVAEHVVLACGARAAARILGGEIAGILSDQRSAPAVVVGLGGRCDGGGVAVGSAALVSRRAGYSTLGMLFESTYAPHRAPAGHVLIKAIAGGLGRPDIVAWDDARVVATVGDEVSAAVGFPVPTDFVEVVRHDPGIPQYDLGHRQRLRHVEQLIGRDVHLAGWWHGGVGVNHLISDASRIRRAIMSP